MPTDPEVPDLLEALRRSLDPARSVRRAQIPAEAVETLKETLPQAIAGQAEAKAPWERLPVGTPVFVRFMGGARRPARRTKDGWESDDGSTGCTPWSVRVSDVWIPAAAAPVLLSEYQQRIEAAVVERLKSERLGNRPSGPARDERMFNAGLDAAEAIIRAALGSTKPGGE